MPPAVKGAAATANLDILTPRFPARRPLGHARLILCSHQIQVWLKDDPPSPTPVPFTPEPKQAQWRIGFDLGNVEILEAPELNPEQSLLEREKTLRFHHAVQQLSDQQRRCLSLRLEGLRYPEIGSVLGISASAVGEFLRRAIARLKKGAL